MIQQTHPSINVEELMVRVRAEAAAMRAAAAGATAAAMLSPESLIPSAAFAAPNHAEIGALLADAARNSAPRTTLPRRFNRFPWSLFRPVLAFLLRLNNYALKDQRHVNAATEMALRLTLTDNAALHSHLQQMAQRLETLDARSFALETAMTMNAGRIGALESQTSLLGQRTDALESATVANAALGPRTDALERAMTINADRIGTLELTRLPPRVGALEEAMTVNAGRIGVIEAHMLDPRVGALEHAMTLAASNIDRLYALDGAGRADKLEVALNQIREHMLRADASIRADLSAHLRSVASVDKSESTVARVPGAEPAIPKAYDTLLLELADRFRGDAETVSSRHRQYLDIVTAAGVVDDAHPVVDVGAGRAEWLKMLKDNCIPGVGIDQSELLVERAHQDGLAMSLGDAIDELGNAATGSIGVITALHIIEHLSFERLVQFLDEALRVLRPNGLLIIETPNPANIVVGACNFWLDPTHVRPIPAALAKFLVEARGFADAEVVEMTSNRSAGVPETDITASRLNDFMYGPQEYAIVARRPG